MFCNFCKMFHTKGMEVSIILWLQSLSNKYLDVVFQGVSYLASWIGAVFLFAIVILFVNKKFGIVFGFGFLASIGINYLLKVVINRPRPFEVNQQIANKLQTIGKSFPSGHMVSCIFIVLSIWLLIKILRGKGKLQFFNNVTFRAAAYFIGALFIVLTAISRMYLGQHYLSDLLGGALVSIIGFALTYFVYKKFDKKQNKC